MADTDGVFSCSPGASNPFPLHTATPREIMAQFQVCGDIHLCDRKGLVESLRHLVPRTCSDSDLVKAAYLEWGPGCASRFSGEFAFVVWDPAEQRLFGCRDHLARRSFYYSFSGTAFCFGDEALHVARALTAGPQPNLKKLAGFSFAGGHHYFDEETFFLGVFSLPGGTALVFDRQGLRKFTFWEPQLPEGPQLREDEAWEGLRELLFAAVGERLILAEKPAALLSGGLDFSALTVVAAALMESRGEVINTFSAVNPDEHLNAFGDERPFIEEFRPRSNIRLNLVRSEGGGPFDRIDEPEDFARTFQTSPRAYLQRAVDNAAAAQGVDLMFQGVGGEFGPSSHGRGYLLELLWRGKFPTLFQQLSGVSAQKNLSRSRLLASEVLGALFPDRKVRPIIMLNPAFARTCEARPLLSRHLPDHRSVQLNGLRLMLKMHANPSEKRMRGPMRFTTPLLDKRIVEFCLRVPGDCIVRGMTRYLIRRSLDGLLPPKIQWRPRKMHFSPDYPLRYSAQLPRARSFVERITASDPVREIVDVKRLASTIDNAPATAWDALLPVPNSIYLICFLRQFSQFRVGS